MTRREALTAISSGVLIAASDRAFARTARQQSVLASAPSITIDDPTTTQPAKYDSVKKNEMLLATLAKHDLKAALFVCGKRVDSPEGKALIERWNREGHLICNHSYSHLYYHARNLSFEGFRDDMIKGETLIAGYSTFTKLFRYPFLKEGDTKEKRDNFREFLEKRDYRNGYVTLDTSDWYIDDRVKARLKLDKDSKLDGFREYYLAHIWDRAQYYDKLAVELTGRQIAHTILLHHTLTNALWLDDLIAMFKDKRWQMVNASVAYADPIFRSEPNILPAGESLVWALAKASEKYLLRYPGEDDTYEKEKMDVLGL
jgi:hypothetical protein